MYVFIFIIINIYHPTIKNMMYETPTDTFSQKSFMHFIKQTESDSVASTFAFSHIHKNNNNNNHLEEHKANIYVSRMCPHFLRSLLTYHTGVGSIGSVNDTAYRVYTSKSAYIQRINMTSAGAKCKWRTW